ncbi:MAG: hypothetical protein DRI44_02860 [Chlamydiae bacterium]|nr:MAG: hypothetical protein DRI44_02860 [Chlamydiota bacterium]
MTVCVERKMCQRMNVNLQHKRILIVSITGLLILLFGIVSGCRSPKVRLQEVPDLENVNLKMTDLSGKSAKLVNIVLKE